MNGRKTFSKNVKRILFEKLKIVENKDPKIWRKDGDGKTVCFPSYGDVHSRYGWNIHHIDENPCNNGVRNLIALFYETHINLHNR